jgi:hypothetical protein
MWFAGLPNAVEPLWQVAHPVVIPVWLNCAPVKVVVDLWHSSHAAVVGTCVAGLPNAVVPLWQVAHPVTIPV